MNQNRFSIKNSITTKLFQRFFLYYIIVALGLTAIQMVTEYNHVKLEILRELESLVSNIEQLMAQSIWDVDQERLKTTADVLNKLSIIDGIDIHDEQKNILVSVVSKSELQQGKISGNIIHSLAKRYAQQYDYTFDIVYQQRNILVGKGTIRFSSYTVINRVQYGFFLIILNSFLKTAALFIVYLFVSSSILTKPLNNLVQVIKSIELEDLEKIKIPLQRKGGDELTLIEKTLGEMIQRLILAGKNLREKSTELEEKNIKLEQANRLKDEFLANTSHELRTPLHGIMGIAQSLSKNLEKHNTEHILSNLNTIVRTGRHLSILVDDVLDFSKLKHHSLQIVLRPVDMNQAVKIVCQIFKPLIQEKNLQIENKISKDLPMVMADEVRVQQILQNLIGNAVKFTQRGKITLKAIEKENMVTIAITNTSHPIPEDKHETIFKPFEQLDGSISRIYSGTGLGLTIARQLVKLQGGEISINSDTSGNTFFISLPLSAESGKPLPHMEASDRLYQTDKLPDTLIKKTDNIEKAIFTILIVDDDNANLQVLINYFAFSNYAVHCTQSGQEALNWVEENGKPDLVLLDIMMPEMSGFEVCKILRNRYDIVRLPILFLTASHRKEDLDTGYALGANDYLTKPFEKSELLSRIRVHLRLSLAKKQLQTMRDCANRIGEFKEHGQMMAFAINKMQTIRLVSSAVLYKEGTIIQKPEAAFSFLHVLPGKEILNKFLDPKDSQLHIINSITDDHPIYKLFKNQCDTDLTGAHLAYLSPVSSPEHQICLYRAHDRLPFSDLDREYMLNMMDQLQMIESNIQTMLSDQLVAALPEIQLNLSKITHITAASPYCSIHLENNPVPREVRITLSNLDLYFNDDLLIRIHRSHLINPDKIISIQKKQIQAKKYKYEVVLENKDKYQPLRVGDSYVEKLKNKYPHFFYD